MLASCPLPIPFSLSSPDLIGDKEGVPVLESSLTDAMPCLASLCFRLCLRLTVALLCNAGNIIMPYINLIEDIASDFYSEGIPKHYGYDVFSAWATCTCTSHITAFKLDSQMVLGTEHAQCCQGGLTSEVKCPSARKTWQRS